MTFEALWRCLIPDNSDTRSVDHLVVILVNFVIEIDSRMIAVPNCSDVKIA